MAQKLAVEKILLKNEKLNLFFPFTHAQSNKFQSTIFEKILRYVKSNSHFCRFREVSGGLNLFISPVQSVYDALQILETINRY
jgi:hypothetical protein